MVERYVLHEFKLSIEDEDGKWQEIDEFLFPIIPQRETLLMEGKLKYENAEVPTEKLEDGRLFIADTTLQEGPHVLAFVKRFPTYWIRDDSRQGYVSVEPVKESE